MEVWVGRVWVCWWVFLLQKVEGFLIRGTEGIPRASCIYMCVYIYMHICVYIYIYAYMCVYIYICICVCVYIYIYMHMCVHIYIYAYVCVYIYAYVCVCNSYTMAISGVWNIHARDPIHRKSPLYNYYTLRHWAITILAGKEQWIAVFVKLSRSGCKSLPFSGCFCFCVCVGDFVEFCCPDRSKPLITFARTSFHSSKFARAHFLLLFVLRGL